MRIAHVLDDVQPESRQALHLQRRAEHTHVLEPEVAQDLRSDPIRAQPSGAGPARDRYLSLVRARTASAISSGVSNGRSSTITPEPSAAMRSIALRSVQLAPRSLAPTRSR